MFLVRRDSATSSTTLSSRKHRIKNVIIVLGTCLVMAFMLVVGNNNIVSQERRNLRINLSYLLGSSKNERKEASPFVHTFYTKQDDDTSLKIWANAWVEAGWDVVILTPNDAKRYSGTEKIMAELEAKGLSEADRMGYLSFVAMATIPSGGWFARLDTMPLEITASSELPNEGRFTSYDMNFPSLFSGNKGEWERLLNVLIQNGEKNLQGALVKLREGEGQYELQQNVLPAKAFSSPQFYSSDWCELARNKLAIQFSAADLRSSNSLDPGADPGVILTQWRELYQLKCKSDKPVVLTFFEPIGEAIEVSQGWKMVDTWKEAWSAAGWQPHVLNLNDAKRHYDFDSVYGHLQKYPFFENKFATNNFLRWMAMSASGGGYLTDFDVMPLRINPTKELPNDGKLTSYERFIPCFTSGSAQEYDRITKLLLENLEQHKEEGYWDDRLAFTEIHEKVEGAFISQNNAIPLIALYPEVTEEHHGNGKKILLNIEETCDFTKDILAIHISPQDLFILGFSEIELQNRHEIMMNWFKRWREECDKTSAFRDVLNNYPTVSGRPTIYAYYGSERDYFALKLWARTWSEAGWNLVVLTSDDSWKHPEAKDLMAQIENSYLGPLEKRRYWRYVAMASVSGGGWFSELHVFPLNPPNGLELPNGGKFTSHDAHATSLFSASQEEYTRIAFMVIQQVDEKIPDNEAFLELHSINAASYHYEDNVLSASQLSSSEFFYSDWCEGSKNKIALRFAPNEIISSGYKEQDPKAVLTQWLRRYKAKQLKLPPVDSEEKDNLSMANQWLKLHQSKCKSGRPVMYTFFEPIHGVDAWRAVRIIEAWKEMWSNAGWEPFVLNLDDAKRHPRFDEIYDLLQLVQKIGQFERANYLRWMAVAAAGGGWMSDFDVVPLHIQPTTALPNEGKFTGYERFIPALVSGSAEEWDRMINLLMESLSNHRQEMWSDFLAMREIHEKQDGYVYRENVRLMRMMYPEIVNKEKGLEEFFALRDTGKCELTKDVMAVHFTYSDGEQLGFRPDDQQSRDNILREWMQAWKKQCFEEMHLI